MRRLVLCTSLILAVGCVRETGVPLTIDASAAADTDTVEVLVFEGACPTVEQVAQHGLGEPIERLRIGADDPSPTFSALDPGEYAFVALGRDGDCVPTLFGCEAVRLGEVDGVTITARVPPWTSSSPCGDERVCMDGRCALGDPPTQCMVDADCGFEALITCEEGTCTPRPASVVVADPLVVTPGATYAEGLTLSAHRDSRDDPYIDLGVVGSMGGGSRSARVFSAPLDGFDTPSNVLVTDLSAPSGVDDVVSLAIRADGVELAYEYSGTELDDSTLTVWVGDIIDPGGTVDWTGLYNPAGPSTALGPDIATGGRSVLGNEPLFFITRTGTDGVGVEMGSIPNNDLSMASYRGVEGAVPTDPELRSSGSAGRWMVMERVRDGELLIWKSNEPTSRQTTGRGALLGRPSIAWMGSDSYAIGGATATGVQLGLLTCAGIGCDLASADTFELSLGGAVHAAALAEMTAGVLVGAAVRPSGAAAVELVIGVVSASARAFYPIGDGTDWLRVATLASGERVHDLRALAVPGTGTPRLVVAALVGDATAASRVVLATAQL